LNWIIQKQRESLKAGRNSFFYFTTNSPKNGSDKSGGDYLTLPLARETNKPPVQRGAKIRKAVCTLLFLLHGFDCGGENLGKRLRND
jgi:hypothetical protein